MDNYFDSRLPISEQVHLHLGFSRRATIHEALDVEEKQERERDLRIIFFRKWQASGTYRNHKRGISKLRKEEQASAFYEVQRKNPHCKWVESKPKHSEKRKIV